MIEQNDTPFRLTGDSILPSFTDHQKIVYIIAQAYLDKLVALLPRSALRAVLVENKVITRRQIADASWQYLYNLIIENALGDKLKEKVFIFNNKYSWTSQLAKIIDSYKDQYYHFGRSIFTRRMTDQTMHNTPYKDIPFDPYTIDKLIDYFTNVKDPYLSSETRKKILRELDIYRRTHLNEFSWLSYDSIHNKSNWVFFKALQKVLSNKEGKFLSISEIGAKVLGGSSQLTLYYAENDIDKNTLIRIRNYCNDNLANQEDLQFIEGMIAALAYANDILLITGREHPKDKEFDLINKIALKIAPLSHKKSWRSSIPTINELSNFFDIDLEPKLSDREGQFIRVFNKKDLIRISDTLLKELAPIDSEGYQELVVEIKNYPETNIRREEIKNQFPNYNDYLNYKYLSIHGDSSSRHLSDWAKRRCGTLGEQIFSIQGFSVTKIRPDGVKYIVDYIFDAFSGNIYKRDAYTATTNGDRSAWELHHIDFDKSNNHPDNLLWVYESHLTYFGTDNQAKRKYIGEGMMIKTAFKHGYAPRSWSLKNQINFYEIMKRMLSYKNL